MLEDVVVEVEGALVEVVGCALEPAPWEDPVAEGQSDHSWGTGLARADAASSVKGSTNF